VNPRVWVAVAVAEVPATDEEVLFEEEDVVVIRVEDTVDEDVVLMLEEVGVEVEVEDCEVVVESTELLLLEELTLRLDERLLDKLLERLLERLFDRLLEMLLEMLLKQLRGHDALVGVWVELVEVVERVWIVLLDETEVVEAIVLEVLEDVVVELELKVEDLTLLVDVWTELESVEDDELVVDFVLELLETEVVEITELEVLEDFWVELEVGEEDLAVLVDVWTELELEVVVFCLEEEEVVVGITFELPDVDVVCDELDVVVWLDGEDDVELVDTLAAEQAPVTDGTALTPELTGMMFDPCNIVSNFGPNRYMKE
jgi:hypothetical protein